MANKADVNVRNILAENTNINVIRKLQDGSSDLDVTIAYNNDDQIHLPTPDVSLLVTAPEGMDTKDCSVHVKSDVDLEILSSRTNSNWIFKIVPNELPPTAPTTVNVEIGDKEPE